MHREINPEFLERLDKIEKQKGIRFNNMKEFDEFMAREQVMKIDMHIIPIFKPLKF